MQNSNRLTRVNELLKREIAEVLYREMNDKGFDFAAVTVTGVEISSNLRRARVLVSLRGDEEACAHMLRMLRHHRADIQRRVHGDVVLKYTPVLSFERDLSIARGDRVLQLLDRIEEPGGTDRPAAPSNPVPEEAPPEREHD